MIDEGKLAKYLENAKEKYIEAQQEIHDKSHKSFIDGRICAYVEIQEFLGLPMVWIDSVHGEKND